MALQYSKQDTNHAKIAQLQAERDELEKEIADIEAGATRQLEQLNAENTQARKNLADLEQKRAEIERQCLEQNFEIIRSGISLTEALERRSRGSINARRTRIREIDETVAVLAQSR